MLMSFVLNFILKENGDRFDNSELKLSVSIYQINDISRNFT